MKYGIFAVGLLVGCGKASAPLGDCGPAVDGVSPDFCLVDINPRSPRSGDSISPRDYLGEVSGWYFIHST